jgi:hypothetical protein
VRRFPSQIIREPFSPSHSQQIAQSNDAAVSHADGQIPSESKKKAHKRLLEFVENF